MLFKTIVYIYYLMLRQIEIYFFQGINSFWAIFNNQSTINIIKIFKLS